MKYLVKLQFCERWKIAGHWWKEVKRKRLQNLSKLNKSLKGRQWTRPSFLKTNQTLANKYTNDQRHISPRDTTPLFSSNKQKVVVLVTEQFVRKSITADTARIRAPCGFKVLLFIMVCEVVQSHRSSVQCPANWFPFLTSEAGRGPRLRINRVFPRHQANFNLYL